MLSGMGVLRIKKGTSKFQNQFPYVYQVKRILVESWGMKRCRLPQAHNVHKYWGQNRILHTKKLPLRSSDKTRIIWSPHTHADLSGMSSADCR